MRTPKNGLKPSYVIAFIVGGLISNHLKMGFWGTLGTMLVALFIGWACRELWDKRIRATIKLMEAKKFMNPGVHGMGDDYIPSVEITNLRPRPLPVTKIGVESKEPVRLILPYPLNDTPIKQYETRRYPCEIFVNERSWQARIVVHSNHRKLKSGWTRIRLPQDFTGDSPLPLPSQGEEDRTKKEPR